MGVDVLIFAIIVLVIFGALAYAVQVYGTFLAEPFRNIICLLLIVIAVVLIAQRAGVF